MNTAQSVCVTNIPKSKPFSINPVLLGVGLAVISNILFSIIYLYSHWLSPLSGTQVFLWRMLAMWLGLCLLMGLTQGFSKLKNFLINLKNFRQWLILLLPTPILASQLWLFMWAPVNGQAINTAMGYFLFPLTMVLLGCLFFQEKLNRLQQLAVLLAGIGVIVQFWQAGSISWATAWVCLTYPIYYGLRRWQGVPALLGLFIDLSVIAPIALLYVVLQDNSFSMVASSGYLLVMIIGLGIISALAMQTNLQANALLPVNVFGMLSYLEPALMFLLSIFVLNEIINQQMLFSFLFIWFSILLMIINTILTKKKISFNQLIKKKLKIS